MTIIGINHPDKCLRTLWWPALPSNTNSKRGKVTDTTPSISAGSWSENEPNQPLMESIKKKKLCFHQMSVLKFGFHTAELSEAGAQLDHSLPAPPPWPTRPGEIPRSREEPSVRLLTILF